MGKYDTTFGGWVLRGFWSSYVVSLVIGGFAFGWIWSILITALCLSIGIPLTLLFLYEHDYIFPTSINDKKQHTKED